MRRCSILLLLTLFAPATSAQAQAAAHRGDAQELAALPADSTGPIATPVAEPDSNRANADSLDALDDTGRPQVARAFGELLILNAAAVGINHLARDIPTAGPQFWWNNIRGGWNWDGNNISTNNVEHPYGGAVYYNVARSNGMSFWAAAPVTLAGSLMWELFGEASAPSLNDLVITTLSGITLGEATRRLSLIVLDNQATGIDRVWREASVLLLNPGMGLDRLSRGQTWRQRANAREHHPGNLRGIIAVGARRLTLPGSADATMDVAAAAFGLQYGDPFTSDRVRPFSYFTITAELNSGPSTTLAELGTPGMLASLGRRDGPTMQVAGVFMDFEYRWNESYQFSEQSIGVGLLSRTGDGSWRVNTDVSAELLPLVASSDPYADALVSRGYDYGAGAGGRALASLEFRGARVLTMGYRGYWTATVNGASQTKLIQFATVEARAPLVMGLSAGAAYSLYLQRSTYAARASATTSLPSLLLFISTSGR